MICQDQILFQAMMQAFVQQYPLHSHLLVFHFAQMLRILTNNHIYQDLWVVQLQQMLKLIDLLYLFQITQIRQFLPKNFFPIKPSKNNYILLFGKGHIRTWIFSAFP